MVDCQVTFFEDRSQLELVGGNLVVTCLDRNTQFQSLDFKILHECGYTWRYCTEVMVFQLLVLRSFMSHQCTACKQQVGTCGVKSFIDQEIFLFPSQVGNYLLNVSIEIMAYIYRSLVYGTQSLQQRSLVVK